MVKNKTGLILFLKPTFLETVIVLLRGHLPIKINTSFYIYNIYSKI